MSLRRRFKRERRATFEKEFGPKVSAEAKEKLGLNLPSKKKIKQLQGVRWTRRLIRHGGLRRLQLIRLGQLQFLANAPSNLDLKKHQRELAKNLFEWMQENPLRVMPVAALEYFNLE
jgi:hypothetical protein